jgi:TM2 domain-containing membrane protein YozV
MDVSKRTEQPMMRPRPAWTVAEKSKSVAGVLAFFLGAVGAHRFYVHRDGSGALYVLATFFAALPVALHYRGWWDDAFDTKNALEMPAYVGLGLLVLLVLIGWVEAARFWAMHERKFARLYWKHVEPTQEAAPRLRPVADEDLGDASDASDEPEDERGQTW